MADQLCTTAQAKLRIRIPAADGTDDSLISDLIDGVSAWIQGHTHRRLLPDTGVTYVFDTAAGSEILVPRGIRAVTTLLIATTDQVDTGPATGAVLAADIHLRPLPMDRRQGWPADRIVIGGSAARLVAARSAAAVLGDFDFAATPADVSLVAADAVAAAYGARGKPASSTIGATGRATFPWAQYFGEDTPAYRTLERYRLGGRGIA